MDEGREESKTREMRWFRRINSLSSHRHCPSGSAGGARRILVSWFELNIPAGIKIVFHLREILPMVKRQRNRVCGMWLAISAFCLFFSFSLAFFPYFVCFSLTSYFFSLFILSLLFFFSFILALFWEKKTETILLCFLTQNTFKIQNGFANILPTSCRHFRIPWL